MEPEVEIQQEGVGHQEQDAPPTTPAQTTHEEKKKYAMEVAGGTAAEQQSALASAASVAKTEAGEGSTLEQETAIPANGVRVKGEAEFLVGCNIGQNTAGHGRIH